MHDNLLFNSIPLQINKCTFYMCEMYLNLFNNGKKTVLVFGHRGNPVSFPENTISSFSSAVELGVDFLETDLRLTKDDKIVLCHDATLKRTTNRKGRIRNLSYEELQDYDAGYNFTKDNGLTYPFRDKGIKIPALFDLIRKYPKMHFNVDMKDRNSNFPQLLLDLIEQFGIEKQVIVGSFHSKQVRRFRKINPNIPLVASLVDVHRYYFNNRFQIYRLFKSYNFDIMQIPQKFGFIDLMKSSFIDGLQKLNIPCHVWTVNSIEELKKMISLNVNGIFTNDPEMILNFLKQKEVHELLASPTIT